MRQALSFWWISAAVLAAQPAGDWANPVKKDLNASGLVIGGTATLDKAGIMANAGFDFLWMEGEHGPIAPTATGGGLGLFFPFTRTPEPAPQVLAACKYPPEGLRGTGPSLTALRWPAPGGYPAVEIGEIAAVQRVMAAKHQIPVGGPGGAGQVKRMIAEGYRFIEEPSDLSLMQAAARDFFTTLQKEGVERKDPVPLY